MVATNRKNLICRSNLNSAFELMYGFQPQVSDGLDHLHPPPVSVFENDANKARKRVNLMLGKEPHASKKQILLLRLPVPFYNDGEGWLEHVKILRNIQRVHYESAQLQKNSDSFNRVKKLFLAPHTSMTSKTKCFHQHCQSSLRTHVKPLRSLNGLQVS